MARIVLPVAGAVVSTALGAGPAVGWAAGSLIAGVFFPPDLGNVVNEGARLNDLKITNADYGAIMPKSYGTVGGIGGTVIWAKDIIEQKITNTQDVGGKGGGGGTVTSIEYKYFGTFAVAFGEGEAVEVLRIWADNKILFDGRSNADSGGSTFDRGFTDFTFYPGTETQGIDPLIAEDQGDLANANRGVCYIVFDNLPLQNFGNRLPNITAEIKFAGDASIVTEIPLNTTGWPGGADSGYDYFAVDFRQGITYSLHPDLLPIRWNSETAEPFIGTTTLDDQLRAWYNQPGVNYHTLHPIVAKDTGVIYVIFDSITGSDGIAAINPTNMEIVDVFLITESAEQAMTSVLVPSGLPGLDIEYLVYTGVSTTMPGNHTAFTIAQINNPNNPFSGEYGVRLVHYPPDGGFETDFGHPTEPGGGLSGGGYLSTITRPLTNDIQSFETYFISGWEGTGLAGVGGDESTNWRIIGIEAQAVGTLTANPLGPFLTKTRDFYYNLGELRAQFPELPWPGVECGVHYQRLSAFDKSNYDVFVIQLAVEDLADDTNTEFFYFAYSLSQEAWIWGSDNFHLNEEFDSGALTDGTMQHYLLNSNTAGFTYKVEENLITEYDMSTGQPSQTWPANVPDTINYLIYDSDLDAIVDVVSGRFNPGIINFKNGLRQGVAVQDILDDLATRVGFDSNPYLETTPAVTQGYFIGNAEAARQSIERLSVAYKFNVIESDFGLKVKNLSDAPTPVAITESELVERDSILEESRVSESSMPAGYSLTFVDVDFDYQPTTVTAKVYNSGEQVTPSQNVAASNLNIVMDKDEAKQLAEAVLETTWEERWGVNYKIAQKYLYLEPTDYVTLNAASAVFEHRLSSSDLGTNLTMEIEGINADNSTYTSDSTSDGNLGFRPPSLPSANDTRQFIIDTPLLRDIDSPGSTSDQVYHAGGSFGVGQYQGALVQKSLAGTVYASIGQFTSSASWGTVVSPLDDTDMPFTPDTTSTLVLSTVAGTLSSTDDDSLLTDFANAIALYKSDGSIEVVQVRDVVDNGDNTYTCTYILRGRRGTDYTTGNNEVGSVWVSLDLATTQTFPQPLEEVNTQVYFRTIPVGQTVLDARVIPFTSEGNSLKPYAPVNEEVTTDNTDITITWERRTRINGGLQNGEGEVPLNEDSEAYEIDIYNAFGDAVIRTLNSTTTTVDYLNADIIADFGAIPATLKIAVYQMSAQVGRGFSVIKTLEVENV